jgi:hypothetical protein
LPKDKERFKHCTSITFSKSQSNLKTNSEIIGWTHDGIWIARAAETIGDVMIPKNLSSIMKDQAVSISHVNVHNRVVTGQRRGKLKEEVH